MINRNYKTVIEKFFNRDGEHTALFAEVYDAAEFAHFELSIGTSIKAGPSVEEPVFVIDKGDEEYYINLKFCREVMLFDESNRDRIIKMVDENKTAILKEREEQELKSIVFIDSEIEPKTEEIIDLAALKNKNDYFHKRDTKGFKNYVSGCRIICGHNIVSHDLRYLGAFFDDEYVPIDTLYMSALLFPKKPYHKLVKDDKIWSFEKNNPLTDARRAAELFYDEINAFEKLDEKLKAIYYMLLSEKPGYAGFFRYVKYTAQVDTIKTIRERFDGSICTNADIGHFADKFPRELAYALAVISTDDEYSIVPPWILRRYPETDNILRLLRNVPCEQMCEYCKEHLDVKAKLKEYFGYDEFRTFDGMPLQEDAVRAAVYGKSMITVFPTGGGKSLTFQLPALIAGETERGLTVVISPLQALMKDQVDNLEAKGRTEAVAINGLLDPISRKEAIDRVRNGTAQILYISPESLRNNTIRDLIKKRTISRFVIDEAHCFSSWGQDFRVDYLYIGKFIREIQKEKRLTYKIPVSCFTATAGKRVIEDICNYFERELNLHLETFVASAERKNLTYTIIEAENEDKYKELRTIIDAKECPTIVYVFSVKKTLELVQRLCSDGYRARAFNGEMDANEKKENQEAFINNEIDIMVATSAFGMGVDKDDINLVVHYQVPASLEDYMQESGRAGRKEGSTGDCIAMFNEQDIEFLFYFLNQSKLTFEEIQSIWRAIKNLSKGRTIICKSPLEIAEEAGWTDNNQRATNTAVRAAIGALENAGYIERQNNITRLFATGIGPDNMAEAVVAINKTTSMNEKQKVLAKRIMKELLGSRMRAKAGNEDSSKKTDAMAENLAAEHREVIEVIQLLKKEDLLEDSGDLNAYIHASDTQNKSLKRLNRFLGIEEFLIKKYLSWEDEIINYKELNEVARAFGVGQITPAQIKSILYFWSIKEFVRLKKQGSSSVIEISYVADKNTVLESFNKRRDVSRFIIEYLYDKSEANGEGDERKVEFSLLELQQAYESQLVIHEGKLEVSLEELQDALIYIQRMDAIDVDGGFFVLYQPIKIRRLELNNRKKYTKNDYESLRRHYEQKVRQIHMMSEYAHLMVENPKKARKFAQDYFLLDNDAFDRKYFSSERRKALGKNISPKKYEELFGQLSDVQEKIINDDESRYITVAAGPGSGKTMVLVHKLASLVLLEDVKCEQLLMLTFSRLPATEFKERLIKLIGKAAYNVEIKTFHSYCFDILGRRGNLVEADNIVSEAVRMIEEGEIEHERITKAVLVVDEAQDMSADESRLINVLANLNEDMRVILVGDDDQNIFEFRGSDSRHMKEFADGRDGAEIYSMTDNYRSSRNVVDFANKFAKFIPNRLKSKPGHAVKDIEGKVTFTKYSCDNLEVPIINKIKDNSTYNDTCVLTWTNEEAFRLMGALYEEGINARLIQSNDNFKLSDLIEIRKFRDIIEAECSTPTIPDDVWQRARDAVIDEYEGSSILETCLKVIDTFEGTNDAKYKTDLDEYLLESKFEDFVEGKENEIVISTIHKAKGREYKNVYLALNNCAIKDEQDIRVLYVGATRAKENLHILCNNGVMDAVKSFVTEYEEDNMAYQPPERAQLQLGHEGVYLDYFIGYQKQMGYLRCGDKLEYNNGVLFATIGNSKTPIARLSRKGREQVERLVANDTKAVSADIRFVIYWRKQESGEEYKIVLPNIYLDGK